MCQVFHFQASGFCAVFVWSISSATAAIWAHHQAGMVVPACPDTPRHSETPNSPGRIQPARASFYVEGLGVPQDVWRRQSGGTAEQRRQATVRRGSAWGCRWHLVPPRRCACQRRPTGQCFLLNDVIYGMPLFNLPPKFKISPGTAETLFFFWKYSPSVFCFGKQILYCFFLE